MEPIIPCIFSVISLQKWAFLDSKLPWKMEIGESSLILTNMLVVEPGWKVFLKVNLFQLFNNCISINEWFIKVIEKLNWPGQNQN